MKTYRLAIAIIFVFIMWLAGFAQDEKPISQELRELDEASSKKVPASLLEAGRKGAEEIRASGILEKALNKGAKMPEFTLSDALNKPVKSKDLLRQGHLIIVFYRGAW